MNTIKYILYISLLLMGYNAYPMLQPLQPYENHSAFNKRNSLFRQPHETRLEHAQRMDKLQKDYIDEPLAQKEFDDLVQKEFKARAAEFHFDISVEALLMDPRDLPIFFSLANSQETIDKLKKDAKATVAENIKQKEANVAANILLANKQISNNQLLHTSPEKPNKTLSIDKKRKLIRPQQGSTTPGCMTPPAKRRLFEIE